MTATAIKTRIGRSGRFGSAIKSTRTAPPSTFAEDHETRFHRDLRKVNIARRIPGFCRRWLRFVSKNSGPSAVSGGRPRKPAWRSVPDEKRVRKRLGFKKFGPHCASLNFIPSRMANARTNDALVRAQITPAIARIVSKDRRPSTCVQNESHAVLHKQTT